MAEVNSGRLELGDTSGPSSDRIEITVDATLFSESSVLKACYTFTDRCHIQVERQSPQAFALVFLSRTATELSWLTGEFRNELISQNVRERIQAETRVIRELIVAQAFAEADLTDGSPGSG